MLLMRTVKSLHAFLLTASALAMAGAAVGTVVGCGSATMDGTGAPTEDAVDNPDDLSDVTGIDEATLDPNANPDVAP